MEVPEIGPVPRAADRRRRAWLSVLVLSWGVQAIVTQSLLLREALVLMFGSEFAWGVVLFAWLLGVALGAVVGGWTGERLRRPQVALVAVLLTLSAAACMGLWAFRGARTWLGVEPGELLPLPQTALVAMLLVSPAGALVGLAFPLACCVRFNHEPRASARAALTDKLRSTAAGCLSFGRVYALESAGSLIGGAAFSFWAVEHLSPIQTALLCGAVTAAASAALLVASPRKPLRAPEWVREGILAPARKSHEERQASACAAPRGLKWAREGILAPAAVGARRDSRTSEPLAAAGLALVAVAAVLVAVFAGDALNRRLVDRRWHSVAPGYELVAETESKYQNLAIGYRDEQYSLYCDGQVTTAFPDRYTFAPLAHLWLCQHPSPRNVLVLGGGAEGLLAEILRHPIEHVDYVEPDPRQIELMRPFLAEVDRAALDDPRVTVHHVDTRYYVKTQRNRFDLVIVCPPEPTSALRARFYTDQFYGELRRAMTSRSVLCMTALAAEAELGKATREYLASIRATLRRHFSQVVIAWGNPAQVLAATDDGLLMTDPAELTARYRQRGVESDMFHPALFGAKDWLDPAKLARRRAELDAAEEVQISTDLRPVVYLQRLGLWEAVTGGGVGPGRTRSGVIQWLRSVSLARLVAALASAAGLALIVERLRRRARHGWAAGAITLSVGTTGFATMALSIVWLFAFQNLYGYVYQRIGWIIALFMAGLVLGCALAERVGGAVPTIGRGKGGQGPPCGTGEEGGPGPPYRVWRYLMAVDVLLALLALAVPFVLPALGALQSSPGTFVLVEWCVSIMVVATGLLGGAAFPLAGRLQLGLTGRPGAAAGSVVGADHAGACLGALLCGILLVPVFGTAAAAFLLAGMKLSSAVLLAAGQRFARAA